MVEARQARLTTLLRSEAIAVAVAVNAPDKLDEVLAPPRALPSGAGPLTDEEKWWGD